jgi:hypothetical protein
MTSSEISSQTSEISPTTPTTISTTQATTIEVTKLVTDVASTISVIDSNTGSKNYYPTASEFIARSTADGLISDFKTTKAISVGTTAGTGDRPIRFPDISDSISTKQPDATKTQSSVILSQGTSTFSPPLLKSSTGN